MKPVKLKIKSDLSLSILGIISTETDLKLTWTINKILNIRLSKSESIKKQEFKTNQTREFSLFQFDDESHLIKYSLLKNKEKHSSCFEEFKNVDYIIFIRGELNKSYKEQIYLKLKNSSEFSSLILIEPYLFKNKEKLELF